MLSYAKWLIRNRWWVIAAALVVTSVLGAFGAGLQVVIDPANFAPQDHPYVQATNRIEKVFGSKYLMLIGVTPKSGDIFQPAVLERVKRMTEKLNQTPGVVRATMLSLAARKARNIQGNAEGFEAKPLMENVPATPEQMAALRAALVANPIYLNTVVSKDFRTAAILLELKERSDGFRKMVAPVQAIVAAEAGPDVDITMGGNPVFLDMTEKLTERINLFFPVAILIIALLHFEAFRTKQGMILPLVTAIMAVLWGKGFMGILHQELDIFNTPTPILILAVAAGHAVQLLKRYYEEYEALRASGGLSPKQANTEAVIRSVVGVGPVMMIAGTVAALGFFSLLVFNIATIRTFGIFTGLGILSAVLLEMTFIPAVRSVLPAPSDRDRRTEAKQRIWDRVPRWIAGWVIPPRRRRWMLVGAVFLCGFFVVSMKDIVIDNANKRYFASWLPIQHDDEFLNRELGGTNSLYLLVEGKDADAIKDPAVLKAIDNTQRFAESQPYTGKTLSIVDFIKRMHRAMNGDKPEFDRVPEGRDLVSQYLLLYSISGEPGDFESYVDYDYRSAKAVILLKTGSTAYIEELLERLKTYAAGEFGPNVKVSFGGGVAQTMALTEVMVHGKIRNIVQICLAIFVISALVFRSLLAGVIVLMPLLLSVCAVFGVMGLTGIPLNIPNSLIAAMAVGIGADYAIYLLYRMREEAAKGADAEGAVRTTLATAGKACLFVATAVAGGYGVLMLSIGYNIHLWLSIIITLAMIVSAFASLTLVPGLVLALRPAFIFSPIVGMRWTLVGLAALIAVTGFVLPRLVRAQDSSEGIMQRSLAATKVKDSIGKATFTLVNKDGDQRVRRTTGYTKLEPNGIDNKRTVRFLSPADINGTATLLIEHAGRDDDLWIYLPALKKVRRLSASNKKDSFVGTEFSYGDVIGHRPEEWNHVLLREEPLDGEACYLIESVPKNETVKSNSGYSKRISWIRKDNFVAARVDYWDLGGELLKRITASDIRPVGKSAKWQPMRSEAVNLQTGYKTIISFEEFKADQGVGDDYFTPRYLEK